MRCWVAGCKHPAGDRAGAGADPLHVGVRITARGTPVTLGVTISLRQRRWPACSRRVRRIRGGDGGCPSAHLRSEFQSGDEPSPTPMPPAHTTGFRSRSPPAGLPHSTPLHAHPRARSPRSPHSARQALLGPFAPRHVIDDAAPGRYAPTTQRGCRARSQRSGGPLVRLTRMRSR